MLFCLSLINNNNKKDVIKNNMNTIESIRTPDKNEKMKKFIASLTKDAIENFRDTFLNDLTNEQLRILQERAQKEISEFLESDRKLYNSLATKVTIFDSSDGEFNVLDKNENDRIRGVISERPDILKRIYEEREKETSELEKVQPVFVINEDAFSDDYGFDNLGDVQKKKIEGILKKLKDEIIAEDEKTLEFAHRASFGEIDNELFVSHLSDYIHGRKDLFLRIFKEGGGKTINDVISVFEVGTNRGKPSAWFSIPCKDSQYNEFYDRYGFEYPEREIAEILNNNDSNKEK